VTTNKLLVAIFCIFVFGAAVTPPISAQAAASPQNVPSMKPWNLADETTFSAAIREVVSQSPTGAPKGLNLMMSGLQSLSVSVGPYLSDEVTRSLAAGEMIQAVGIVHAFNGQNYLLARQLVVGGRTIEVRNTHGFLIHPSAGPRSGSAHPQGLLGGVQ
jgi:hypothetical protein